MITAAPLLNRIQDLTACLDIAWKVGGLGAKLAKNDEDDEDPDTINPESEPTLEEVFEDDGNRVPNDPDLDFTSPDEVDEHRSLYQSPMKKGKKWRR